MTKKAPSAPKGLGTRGAKLWRAVHGRFELRVDEELLLEEACRCADRLVAVRREGDAREERLQQEQLRKLLRSIDWPEPEHGVSASDVGRHLAHRRWHRGA